MKPRDSHRLFVLVCLLVSFSASLPDPQVLCPTFVDEGERLMCECSSPNDVHNPTITWPGHSDTYMLDKSNISRYDNGTTFTCRMESNGQISTAIYTLQVAYGPSDNTVEITGPDVFVTDGSVTLTLTCNASDVNPPDVNYAWYGLGLYCDGGNQGSTCSFRPQPRQHDGKIVTCRASNGAGQTIVTAKTDYVLNLTYPPTSSPVITGFTEGQVLKVGDNLTCTVADGKPLVSDVFFHCTNPTLDDQSDVADQSSVSSTVTIDSVNATGSETYCICTADWEPGKYNITYELNNSAVVYIEYAATILNFTINNSTDVVEMIQTDHTTATLECTSLGQPTPELRMTRHGEEIQSTALKSSSGYVENVLVISAVTCEDMGIYMCLADNGQQDTRSVRLIVNCAPSLIDPEGDSNLPEMAVNGLFLSMVAHPVPYSFSWEQTRQSDNNGTRNIATLFLVTCVNSGHLEYLVTCEIHAVNLSETEAGLYSVSLSNGYGEYTYNFKISGDQGLTQEDESSPEGGTDDIIISLSVVGGLAFFVLLFIGIKTALSCFSKGPDRGRREVSQAVLQNVASSSDDLSPPQPSTSETKGSPHSYENRGQLRHSDPGYASAEDVHLHAPPSSPAGLHRQSAAEHATRDSGGYASLSDNSRPSNNYCAYSTPVEKSLSSVENGTEGRITDADKSDPSVMSKGPQDNTTNGRPKAGGSQWSSNKYTHVVKPKRAGKGVGSTTKPVIAPIADENSTNTNDKKGNGSGSVDGNCVKTPNTEPLSQDPSQSVVTEESYNILQFHRHPTVADIKTDYSHIMNG